MTNKKQEEKIPTLSYDHHTLRNAQVADIALKRGDVQFAKSCLETIIKDTKQDTWADGLIYSQNPTTIQEVINSQLQTYYAVQKKQSIENVVDYYSSDIVSFIGNKSIEDFKKELGETLKKNYIEILTEVTYSEKVIEDKKQFPNQISDKDVEKAEKIIKKYGLVSWISKIEQNKLSQFEYRLKQKNYSESMPAEYKEIFNSGAQKI